MRPRSARQEFSTLIGVEELLPHVDNPTWVVIDCRFTLSDPATGETAYGKSRLPGSRYAHLERDLSGRRFAGSGRNPLPRADDFSRSLAAWGIRTDSQVVVYDDSFGSVACRLWALLQLAGHRKVALLDGGWPVWKRKKGPLEETPLLAARVPAALSPTPLDFDATRLADADAVERIRNDPDWALIDARPEERYTGERETVDPVAGHIPGSRHWTFEDNLDFDGTFLSAAELRANFVELLAGRAPDHVVHTCGSGVTACHNLLAMEHAGLHGSRLYAGSWSEWITDPKRPVALGR